MFNIRREDHIRAILTLVERGVMPKASVATALHWTLRCMATMSKDEIEVFSTTMATSFYESLNATKIGLGKCALRKCKFRFHISIFQCPFYLNIHEDIRI